MGSDGKYFGKERIIVFSILMGALLLNIGTAIGCNEARCLPFIIEIGLLTAAALVPNKLAGKILTMVFLGLIAVIAVFTIIKDIAWMADVSREFSYYSGSPAVTCAIIAFIVNILNQLLTITVVVFYFVQNRKLFWIFAGVKAIGFFVLTIVEMILLSGSEILYHYSWMFYYSAWVGTAFFILYKIVIFLCWAAFTLMALFKLAPLLKDRGTESMNPVKALQNLNSAYQDGYLTEEEYNKKRQAILDRI